MATWARSCTVTKCEISSCAVCHCCQKDLCLDHLKEHKDQLNAKLIPLTNQINTSLESLESFTPTSLPSFKVLEQWRIAAHETVDQFYEDMRHELFEQKRNQPLQKLRATRDALDQLIRKQGATHENINSLTNVIQSIEQEINSLQNIQINLRPLVIDKNVILQSNSVESNSVFETIRKDNSFQIFVEVIIYS
jgi:hypothetical protein